MQHRRQHHRRLELRPQGARLQRRRWPTASPGGQFPANAWGLSDMHGNVAEWCLSTYRPYPYRADDGRDEPRPSGLKVVRGGSWNDTLRSSTSASRWRMSPTSRCTTSASACWSGPSQPTAWPLAANDHSTQTASWSNASCGREDGDGDSLAAWFNRLHSSRSAAG